MKNTRSLLFILMLFLIIFSTSFVSANDLTHTDTNGDTLSASDGSVIEENSLNEINFDSIDQSSDSTPDLVDGAQNTNETEDDGCLTYNEKAPVLGVNNDEPILGRDIHADSSNNYWATAWDVVYAIFTTAQPGDRIFLDGATISGTANLQGWQNHNLNGVSIYGGSYEGDTQMATFTNTNGYT